jgi:hypothetical protein
MWSPSRASCKRGAVLGVVVALGATAGCALGSNDSDRPSRFGKPQFVAYPFEDESEGRVGLSAAGARRTRIAVDIEEPPAARQHWEVRTGRCPPTGPMGGVQYELSDLVDGQGEAVVPVPLGEFIEYGYALFIYPYAEPNNVTVVCVDLTEAEPSET